jgi:hypothetical protein
MRRAPKLICLKAEMPPRGLLTQIDTAAPSAPRLQLEHAIKGPEKMFNSSELRDELQSLKSDVSRLFDSGSDGIFDNSKARAEALAEQIKGRAE